MPLHWLYGARHMFEVEQVDYDKEQIDWSYITFNDNKVVQSRKHVIRTHIGLRFRNFLLFESARRQTSRGPV